MAKSRSPNYPAISLADAVAKARKIWDAEHHSRMSAEAAIKGMGYNSVNGASLVQLSALKKYGLLDGEGDDLRLGQDALTILHDAEGSPGRAAALRRAALRPALFQELRKHFGEHIPSDNNLRSHLLQKKFIPVAANAASRSYRETMELVTKQGIGYNAPDAEEDNGKLSVGDLVNWESQGVLQNEKPFRIKGFSEDGAYAFVEGTPTGLPVSELTRVEGSPMLKPAAEQPQAPLAPPPLAPLAPGGAALLQAQGGVKQDVFSLAEGQAVLRWPETLSAESYQEFKAWLELVMRKAGRAAGVPPSKSPA